MKQPDPVDAMPTRLEKLRAQQLESELFGGSGDLVDRLAGDAQDSTEAHEPDLPFSISAYVRDVAASGDVETSKEVSVSKVTKKNSKSKRKPVWVDDDDAEKAVDVAAVPRFRKLRKAHGETLLAGEEFEARLRGQHKKLNPGTTWADPKAAGTSPDEEAVSADTLETSAYLRQVGGITQSIASRDKLPSGSLELTRVHDANMHNRSKGVVQCVEFHPNGQLLMTGALDKRLSFFQADGVRNSPVESVFLEDMPIHTAQFTAGGSQVIASGRRKFFYVCDIQSQKVERIKNIMGREERSFESFVTSPAATSTPQTACIAFLGNEGTVPLVSLSSRQLAGELKMNGTVRSAAFSADGVQLYTGGSDGVVYVWDVRMRRCVHRQRDEGCVHNTALAVSPSGGFFAAGSDSGVVNVYNGPTIRETVPGTGFLAPTMPVGVPPVRVLNNLVTSVDTMQFNHDSQLLCVASRMKKDSLRLVHLPSMTVFSNWPTGRSPLGYVHCAAFSPNGGFFAVGNAKGHVLLYRLHHYSQA